MDFQKIRIQEIESQIDRFQKRLNKLELKSRNLGTTKAIIFLLSIGILLASFFYWTTLPVIVLVIIFLIIFGVLTKLHNKIDLGIKKLKIWIEIKSTNLARINIDWRNLPSQKIVGQNKSHPFEFDLNISGEYSVHRLIDSSVTIEGSLRLLKWLTTRSPSLDDIMYRQSIVKELIPLTKFRERLQLNSRLVTRKILEGKKVLEWLFKGSNINSLKKILITLSFAFPLNMIFILLAVFGIINSLWPVTSLLLLFIYYTNLKLIDDLYDKLLIFEEEIGKFYVILKFLESYQYGKNQNLKNLCSSFINRRNSPSAYFKKIERLIFWASFQKNPLTRLIFNVLYPWDFFQAYKFEKIKIELSGQLPAWLETWYNLEALISIANYANLNPGYSFPQIKESPDDPENIFEAKNISHPLIPFQNNIANDFKINKKGEVIIITGSNMSGKSTFLKTVGSNLALAFAGSVVNAKELKTNLFRIFSSMNISDSVIDGISFFYAEIKRLKELLNELEKENEIPLFYFIDEIFKGTNNKERLIGSRSYIKSLAGKNDIGIISTHDLELIKLDEEIPDVHNYHFKEEIIGDKMIFKYKIIKGPSPTTNALKIMKLEGLPID